MVKHKSDNLINRCYLSEEAVVSHVWETWSWARLSRESSYLYSTNTSFPVDPCGEMWSLLAGSQPANCLSMLLSMVHSVKH